MSSKERVEPLLLNGRKQVLPQGKGLSSPQIRTLNSVAQDSYQPGTMQKPEPDSQPAGTVPAPSTSLQSGFEFIQP